ncbi:HAD family hydrolase [Mucilaginibacter lappiensis]|uniref:phosphoglycolate phosphatase n=1 Tax=Mucilaginibacter lappiensis TaxID=354630 RepID=A0A1N6WJ85_9SPHI|nr:HAD hydrolase-like protein [Mucilaginibacter lappiensis]MBB6109574.1 phosphoglycolate phosphatase-like HAD superfamily hydrolase [Mucilaginibacter lappiensis]MBB6127812.1 phosphoglycolate phosphatase-like HAD superfamily hydrolase [Mucilaginibacter lappiensis]SIQ90169.1 Phosphoglycolate phosphatase, HAD superfamily [Mucilaginibacter lappiensis]
MRYIIFDIDGTLTDTTEVDDRCFTQALEDVFGFKGFETNYGHYVNTTDSGIIDQLFQEQHQRSFTEMERDEFISHFCKLLYEAYMQEKHCMKEIPKAAAIINTLCGQEGVSIGLATGGWRESALFKLRCAGINMEGCVAASFAQDAKARRDIIGNTIRQMNDLHNLEVPMSDIVYVGDGRWDYEATKQLGIRFIGINNKKLAEISDIVKLNDYEEIHQHLWNQTVPA